jgi:integration host factor subunit alpha
MPRSSFSTPDSDSVEIEDIAPASENLLSEDELGGETITRAHLYEAVFRSSGRLSRPEASTLVSQIFEEITAALGRNETVKIAGFGSFSPRNKNERIGRNPKTGVSAVIEARRVVSFKASNLVRDRVQEGLEKLAHQQLDTLDSESA